MRYEIDIRLSCLCGCLDDPFPCYPNRKHSEGVWSNVDEAITIQVIHLIEASIETPIYAQVSGDIYGE